MKEWIDDAQGSALVTQSDPVQGVSRTADIHYRNLRSSHGISQLNPTILQLLLSLNTEQPSRCSKPLPALIRILQMAVQSL